MLGIIWLESKRIVFQASASRHFTGHSTRGEGNNKISTKLGSSCLSVQIELKLNTFHQIIIKIFDVWKCNPTRYPLIRQMSYNLYR